MKLQASKRMCQGFKRKRALTACNAVPNLTSFRRWRKLECPVVQMAVRQDGRLFVCGSLLIEFRQSREQFVVVPFVSNGESYPLVFVKTFFSCQIFYENSMFFKQAHGKPS